MAHGDSPGAALLHCQEAIDLWLDTAAELGRAIPHDQTGPVWVNRSGFQDLSRVRIAEARALLDDGFFAGAYYLTGHAVECALKACVCRLVGLHDFPDRALAARAHTHDLEALVGVARLRPDLDEEVRRSPLFRDNWDTVRAWSVESRYELGLAPPKAAVIYKAVTEEGTGVLNWVTSKW